MPQVTEQNPGVLRAFGHMEGRRRKVAKWRCGQRWGQSNLMLYTAQKEGSAVNTALHFWNFNQQNLSIRLRSLQLRRYKGYWSTCMEKRSSIFLLTPLAYPFLIPIALNPEYFIFFFKVNMSPIFSFLCTIRFKITMVFLSWSTACSPASTMDIRAPLLFLLKGSYTVLL